MIRKMEVYSGFVTVKISGILKSKTLSNVWARLFCSSGGKNSLPPHLDLYVDDKSLDHSALKKSIDIIEASWSKPETLEPAFCFLIKGKRFVFVTQTEVEKNAWFRVLCCLSADLFESQKTLNLSESVVDDGAVIMQDNCLYASPSQDVTLFDVVGDQKSDCSLFDFVGLLKLSFDSKFIKLFRNHSSNPLTEWSYYNIRCYGHSKHVLHLTFGSKSAKKGEFSFITTEGNAIKGLIEFHTQRLKQQENDNGASEMEQINGNSDSNSSKALSKNRMNSGSGSSTSSTSSSNKTKTRPAPDIPSPSPSAKSNVFIDEQFQRQLSQTVVSASQQQTQQDVRKLSIDNNNKHSNSNSTESINSNNNHHKKDDKKAQKEREKEEKRLKKEKLKQEKEREKQEKERQKKLLKEEKEKNKAKPPLPKKASFVAEESVYAEAYDMPSQTHHMNGPPVGGALGVGDYSECDDSVSVSNQAAAPARESNLYSEPWGALKLPIISSTSTAENVYEDDENKDSEDVYTAPLKPHDKNKKAIPKPSPPDEAYEDVAMSPPPIVPPKFTQASDLTSSPDVYNHFSAHVSADHSPEHLYGIESAVSLNDNNNEIDHYASVDVYENE